MPTHGSSSGQEAAKIINATKQIICLILLTSAIVCITSRVHEMDTVDRRATQSYTDGHSG